MTDLRTFAFILGIFALLTVGLQLPATAPMAGAAAGDHGPSIDPDGLTGTGGDHGPSIDPDGFGAGGGDHGPSIDPNG
jgi:hypothetical protein